MRGKVNFNGNKLDFHQHMPAKSLTRREKYQYSQSGFSVISDWLAYRLSKKLVVPINNRYDKVLRWLEYLHDTGRWVPELTKIESLIHEDDILTGRDSPKKVIRKTNIRTQYSNEPLADIPEWYSGPTKTIKLLNSAQDIVLMGAELNVCLDLNHFRERYINDVKTGKVHIFSIKTRCGISAFELSWTKHLLQHRSYKNKIPNLRHQLILKSFLCRIKGQSKSIVMPYLETMPNLADNPRLRAFQNHVESEAQRLQAYAESVRVYLEELSDINTGPSPANS